MPITDEGRRLIEKLLIKLRKEIDTNEELIPVLEEIIGETPPEPEYTVWRILAEPYLNVRSNHFLDSTDIGNVYPGETVNVYEEWRSSAGWLADDVWGRIDDGWIALQLGVNIFAEKV